MQTKFKWTDKQRLLMIRVLVLGITMCPDVASAQSLSSDIYMFSAATPDALNQDDILQRKLKIVFETLATIGTANHLYNDLMKLENEREESSFAA